MDQKVRRLQALRLVTAFIKIQDASIRETIVELAEAAAEGATLEVRHNLLEEEPPNRHN